jgi:formylglycine-generating enzyme required for sulfatase activity
LQRLTHPTKLSSKAPYSAWLTTMVHAADIAGLSHEQRQAFDACLAGFRQSWDEQSLVAWTRHLPPEGTSWRYPALVELVKIDLERRWRSGRPAWLEGYLGSLPELGTSDTVPPELIVAEYEARRQCGNSVDLVEYERRFPRQASDVRELLKQAARAGRPEADAPARHETLPATLSIAKADHPVMSPTADLPEQFGRYRILRRLGQGGMGAVFLAHDTQLDRQVALKVPHFSPSDGAMLLQRFYREAKAAAKLTHPNLCPVHDVGQIDGIHFLTMSYIEGKPLSDYTARGRRIPERQVAVLVRHLALGLQEAHDHGVIHRDLKPSNIMVNVRGEPVIMDFGLARRVQKEEARLTKSGAVLGTPAYMSPEQVRGDVDAMGPGCDIYALGVILYELLTGKLPFDGPGTAVLAQILTREPEPPSRYRKKLDPQLEAICMKAMAKPVPERYATMAAMAAALASFSQKEQPAAGPGRRATPGAESAGSGTAKLDLLETGLETLLERPGARRPATADRVGRRRLGIAAGVVTAVCLVVMLSLGTGTRNAPHDSSKTFPVGGEKTGIADLDKQAKGSRPQKVDGQAHKPVVEQSEGPQPPRKQKDGKANGAPPELNPYNPETLTVDLGRGVKMEFVRIPAGEFDMGSPGSDQDANDGEKPQHHVQITRAFYLGRYPVTQAQYAALTGSNPSYFSAIGHGRERVQGLDTRPHPVESVAHSDAEQFCRRLTEQHGQRGRRFTLPSEAEWEYACRAGSRGRYAFGDDADRFAEYAWYRKSAGGRTHQVGTCQPNAWGLLDMHGNVWQWCADWYADGYYKECAKEPTTVDPKGPSGGQLRVLRGGSWNDCARFCRAAYRSRNDAAIHHSDVGFRVCLRLD